jgi:hypothetical protein
MVGMFPPPHTLPGGCIVAYISAGPEFCKKFIQKQSSEQFEARGDFMGEGHQGTWADNTF